MVEVGKMLLMKTVAMAARKNRNIKYCWGIEEDSFSGDCKDGFMHK